MTLNRQKDLLDLKEFISQSNTDVTMILQSLQWNRDNLISNTIKDTCAYDPAHKVSSKNLKEHEEQCLIRIQGYTKEEKLLPEPYNSNTHAVVKLNSADINSIIAKAAKDNPDFKRGKVWNGPTPLSLERLQATYTVDERRAIYDAVVASDPTSHDISDLALSSVNEVNNEKKLKSRVEILAELRDMRRRRTKYRVAAKTKKYSDVLRDVIETQMEMYTGIRSDHENKGLEKSSLNEELQTDTKSVALERANGNKQKFCHDKNISSAETSVNEKDKDKGKKSFTSERDIDLEINSRHNYNERHYQRQNDRDRLCGNLSNRKSKYRENKTTQHQEQFYERNKYHNKKEHGHKKMKTNFDSKRYSDNPRKCDSTRRFHNYRHENKERELSHVEHDQKKNKAERKNISEKIYHSGYKRTSHSYQ